VIAVERAQRTLARASVGVDVGAALNLVGAIIKYFSLAFLFPVAVAAGYREPVWPFVVGGGIAAVFGWTLERLTRGKERVGAREGFLVVALSWALAAAFGSVPYVLAEPQLRSPINAYFEAMSGFTTTGSSVLTDIPALDRSMAMWRQFTQWLGGMGIIVLALAVLPRLRVGGRQLFESEAPGPESERLATRMRDTARRLWLVYLGISAAMVITLTAIAYTRLDARMSFYEAVAHMFSTLATGGFSTRARSIEEFGAASQWAIAFFMAVAGANFALHYRALLRRANPVRDEELRLYVGILFLASLIIFAQLVTEGLYRGEEAVRQAVFQVVSIMTTTGYASADFNEWGGAVVATTFVGLMLIGGSAGSTAGAMKVVRVLLLGRILRRDLDQTVHPEVVVPVRLNGVAVEERTLRAVAAFVSVYVLIFMLGALALAIDAARVDLDLTPFQAVAASATTLGNVGPAFGFAGPVGSFEPFSDVSTVIMTLLMWLGRLELIPIVVLVTRSYWRG
jgi:trk system potassium uptake protein TrkH